MSAAWPAVRAFAAARWRACTLTSRARIEAWQTRRMAELLARVLPKSAHLRERFGARGPAAWRSLAPTDKAEMMRRLDDLVTVPVTSREAMELALAAERSRDFAPTLGGVAVGLSSGTSGTRGLFLVSAEERALWAGTVLARLLPDVVLRRHRVAFFLRANSALYETLASRRLRFAYFDLAEPLTSHAEPLRRLDPTVLVAPASVLRVLSEQAPSPGIAPRRVISVAEPLEADDAAAVARAFGGVVHQVYQATEGFLGTTCRLGVLHLAEDAVAFDFEPAVPGEPRCVHPIVSNLFRAAQPILRYRLDDVLVLADAPCRCGSAFRAVERVVGRADEVLYGVDARGRPAPVIGGVVTSAVLAAADVTQFLVRQTSPTSIELAVTPLAAADAAGRAVRAIFERQSLVAPQVTVVPEAPVASGWAKRRRVVRAFPRPDAT